VRERFPRECLQGRVHSMWRYREMLPNATPVTLGEGFTPVVASKRHPNVFVKDEGANPTGSFKARGLGMAVTMAKHFGFKKVAIPSAGNAGGAMAAYAAAAGIEAHVYMPQDVPIANLLECKAHGAHVYLIDGLISDCGRLVAEGEKANGWLNISTLKEPFRVEGKKTMGYEVAEQFGGDLPDAIIYPTGGGVGLIGMWKAFEEMEQLGWIGAKRPKMIAVQTATCAPIVKAYEEGKQTSEMWQNAETFASGLRVPKAYGDYLILDIVRKSGGTAVAYSDEEILGDILDWARHEGIFLSPEGAASMTAYRNLLASGFLKGSDKVVLYNTGSAYKYVDVIAVAMKVRSPQDKKKELPQRRNLGGIIQPV
jgi:threonine synthase